MSLGLFDLLLGILPLLILFVFVFFAVPLLMRKFQGPGSATALHLAILEKQTRALERIADALEKRGV